MVAAAAAAADDEGAPKALPQEEPEDGPTWKLRKEIRDKLVALDKERRRLALEAADCIAAFLAGEGGGARAMKAIQEEKEAMYEKEMEELEVTLRMEEFRVGCACVWMNALVLGSLTISLILQLSSQALMQKLKARE